MRILAIETSCDETGLAVFSWGKKEKEKNSKNLTLESHVLFSQVAIHEKFGGVFPALAKRAHAERLPVLLREALEKANLFNSGVHEVSPETISEIKTICAHEEEMATALIKLATHIEKPDIDCIAMTTGPGLEPALWVGVNAAKALALIWNIPLLPINHMEGHVVTAFFDMRNDTEIDQKVFMQHDITYPLLALLVSGGHTELVLMEESGEYKKIGQTRDDAVGEAFDKTARILGLPYPGGPKIGAYAKEFRASGRDQPYVFPRPMLHSQDFDFSFSGLKTSVLYTVQKELKENTEMTDEKKKAIAAAFEDAAFEVLTHKVAKAIIEFHPQTFLIGGGVSGSEYLQSQLSKKLKVFPEVTFLIPERTFTTDNAVMIGLAAYLKLAGNAQTFSGNDTSIRANGNWSIETK